jgi:predicted dehydrogenase
MGGGVLADLGSHALATAEFLLGPVERVLGDTVTVVASRPDGRGGHRIVEVDDIGRAFVRFASGASGSIDASWIATGRKMQHYFEVYGTKGRSSSARSASTSCTSTALPMLEDGVAFGASRPGRITIRMDPSASHRAASSASTTRKLPRWLGSSMPLPGSEAFGFRTGQRIQELVEAIQGSARDSKWLQIGSYKKSGEIIGHRP